MFFKRKNIQVSKIYQNIVEISRSKFFYLNLGLKDDFETRFDLIIFHAFMIFYYTSFHINDPPPPTSPPTPLHDPRAGEPEFVRVRITSGRSARRLEYGDAARARQTQHRRSE